MKGRVPWTSHLQGDQASGLASALSARLTRGTTIYAGGSLAGYEISRPVSSGRTFARRR